MSSKRQQTMAKMTRERKVKERRALKLEKKRAAAEERTMGPAEGTVDEAESAVDAPEGAPPESADSDLIA